MGMSAARCCAHPCFFLTIGNELFIIFAEVMRVETRRANMIVGAAGGTAGRNAKTYKLSIPSSWVREMGLGQQNCQVKLHFDGEQIVVRKAQTLAEFAQKNLARAHEVWMLRYYDGDRLCTSICADFTGQILQTENHTPLLVKTAFGKNGTPSWEDFRAFLEERCIPRTRAGLREYLDSIGLDEYDPMEIIKKTSGRMAEDDQWIKLEALK